MKIKAEVILNIEPIEDELAEIIPGENEEEIYRNVVGGFLECATMQCGWQEDRCLDIDCKGASGYEVLSAILVKA